MLITLVSPVARTVPTGPTAPVPAQYRFTVVTRELYDAHAGGGLAAIPLEPPIEITATLIWRSNDTKDVLQQLIARLDH